MNGNGDAGIYSRAAALNLLAHDFSILRHPDAFGVPSDRDVTVIIGDRMAKGTIGQIQAALDSSQSRDELLSRLHDDGLLKR